MQNANLEKQWNDIKSKTEGRAGSLVDEAAGAAEAVCPVGGATLLHFPQCSPPGPTRLNQYKKATSK